MRGKDGAGDVKAAKDKNRTPALTGAELVELDDGAIIDINAEIKWSGASLTAAQKRFIFFYAYPFSNLARGKGAESARKAGYAKSGAEKQAFNLLRKAEVIAELKNVKAQIADAAVKAKIRDKISEIAETKLKRTGVKVDEFYNVERVVTEEGKSFIKGEIKPLKDLTDEQKALIEDVEFVGQRGTPHYRLPSKREAENEVIKLYKDLYADSGRGAEGYDAEATIDIIKDNLRVKAALIRKNREIAETTEFKEAGFCAGKEVED